MVQLLGMDDNLWVWPDRRDLFHACVAFADPEVSADRVGEAADALLNDLELYDDPRQGHGSWLFPDEFTIADDLATKLHTATADEPLEGWGPCSASPPAVARHLFGRAKTARTDRSEWSRLSKQRPLKPATAQKRSIAYPPSFGRADGDNAAPVAVGLEATQKQTLCADD